MHRNSGETAERGAQQLDQIAAERPVFLDLRKLAATEPQPPQFIVAGWLPQGEVALFAGHGGSGKSGIALHLAVCIALGLPWFGIETQRRRVCFVSLEDPTGVLHWRLSRLCAHLAVSISDLHGWLYLYDGAHADGALMVETREGTGFTSAYAWLRAAMENAQVLVLDGASDAFGGNENARAQVRMFMRGIRSLIPRDGAVVLLAHVDKGSARTAETSQGYSGSTAWSNSARARWYLRTAGEESGELILEQQKANHAQVGGQVRIRWNALQHVFEASGAQMLQSRGFIDVAQRTAILNALRACLTAGNYCPAATTGRRTAFHVLVAQTGFPDSLRADPRGFWRQIEKLRAMSLIREDSIRRKCRHGVAVLVPVEEESGVCGQ
ncbi:MAG TPA: AAA family ATPase [Verrucomicrobiae bacterium]|nr:AAA family ATPase [Verrucomicrobiae bacterium]